MFIAWAVVVGIVAGWTFTPAAPPPPPQTPEANRGKAFGPYEQYLVEGRVRRREETLKTLEQLWSGRCAGETRKAFISGLSHYYYFRQTEAQHYPKYFGQLGADYIAKQWATTDDQRIDRLTQEAYTKGYLKAADFDGVAGKMVAAVVKGERVTGNACTG